MDGGVRMGRTHCPVSKCGSLTEGGWDDDGGALRNLEADGRGGVGAEEEGGRQEAEEREKIERAPGGHPVLRFTHNVFSLLKGWSFSFFFFFSIFLA